MLAERMNRLGTETAFEVLAKAQAMEAEGREIIHLEIGEPDFDTPQHVIDTAVNAIKNGNTHYTPSAGTANIRKTFAEYITRDRGISVNPENIVITPGAKPILFFTIQALVGAGDEVIYPNPGFPIYESLINFVGAKPVPLPLREQRAFSFDPEELKALLNDKTKLIVINSPQNPTGGVLSKDDVRIVADLAQAHDAWILSDEVYGKMTYDEDAVSIYNFPEVIERTVMLDGHSKTYAMTGWRLGYGIMPEWLALHIAKLQTNCTSCTPPFTQIAGAEALTGPQDESIRMMAEFKERRKLVVEGLNAITGITCIPPKGSFYAFPNITGTGMTSMELADYLLEAAGVALLSGTSFGQYGEGYLRISFANSKENLKKALERIEAALKKKTLDKDR